MVEQKALMVCDTSLFSAVTKYVCFLIRKEGGVKVSLEVGRGVHRRILSIYKTVVLFVSVFVCECRSGNKSANSETDKNASFTCR